ncbi:hypothetical protein RclHR1_08820006 [Rhizophagus clarus]|uniref:TPR repeat-containing protein n=1 Tax=Rhizophagus clarus TaxID=94130 RepID=A0A2Z6SD29_9GLOM|nr:hypothetical protein RclHR1_08820006 [Rhizophagus clarus]GES91809.1 TPR repeat-containing protein [Rhizophagus clarus]
MTLETVYAIHSFEAENDDEIPFQVGEPIIILEKDDLYGDSWWKGKNIHGQIGLFPMTYISYERPSPATPISPVRSTSSPNIDGSREDHILATPTSALNMHGSDLDLPLPPFRMPSPSIDETIDDIQDKLQRMAMRTEEEQLYQDQLIQQNHLYMTKNGHSSNKLFTGSSSGSSTTSSHMSSTRKQQSSPHSQFDSVDSTKRVQMHSPLTTVNGKQPIGYPHPVTWNVEQVCTWLSKRGFESEVHHFVENDITGDILINLSISTLLKELNINSFGKRVHIMNAINELKRQFSLGSENDDMSDTEEYHNTQPSSFYSTDHHINQQNSLYSNQHMDSSANLHHHYGLPSNISLSQLPQVNESMVFPDSPRASTPILAKNFPPTYYTYSQRLDDAEGANIETINTKSSNKREKLLAKLNIGKRTTNPPIRIKDKPRTSSTGGWDFNKDDEIVELIKNKRMKNGSEEDEPYLSLEVLEEQEKSRSFNFLHNRKKRPTILDRSSLVGSQLGLPKRSIDLDKYQNVKPSPSTLPGSRNTNYYLPDNVDDVDNNEYLNGPETYNSIGTPDYSGWLKKQGDKYKTWKSRYCILKGVNLFYFKNDKEIESSHIKGYINLTGYRIIPDENLLHGKYGFKLIHDVEKSHYFAHDELDKLKGWMKAMMKATIERDSKAPVISSSNIATVPLSEARKLTPRPPDPRRPSVSSTALNKVSSPILRPISPPSQRTGSPIPTRPLSPAFQTIQNSTSPLMRSFNNNRSTMGFI